jgi:hypothetical protein
MEEIPLDHRQGKRKEIHFIVMTKINSFLLYPYGCLDEMNWNDQQATYIFGILKEQRRITATASVK